MARARRPLGSAEKIALLNRVQRSVDVTLLALPPSSVAFEDPCYVIDCLLANYETALLAACDDGAKLEQLLRPILVAQTVARLAAQNKGTRK